MSWSSPRLKELQPQSGMANGPADIAFVGSILFALFLMGWGLSFVWGPVATVSAAPNAWPPPS